MLEIDGYQIGHPLDRSERRAVFAATRASDGLNVVLKQYVRDRDQPREATRAFREFSLLRSIDAPGVVRALGLERTHGSTVLVLERAAGVCLSRLAGEPERDVETLLQIALGLARGVEAVHAARVLHKDIKPRNVVVDPVTLATCLIDFGHSDEIGYAPRSADEDALDGTLAYMAPERTGRIGAGVDYRSDLYSVGVTLYELFTGVRPFQCKSSLELINAHLAIVPPPPSSLARRTPEMLSRIVMRLLEKDPERRYQSAYGLRADLEECLGRLGPEGRIEPLFVLGAHDGSDQLRFPRTYFGRAAERARLLGALESVLASGVELVLVSGPAGIGKSSLPETLRLRLRESGGYLAQGKFDVAHSRATLGGFGALFGSLLDQMLAETSDRFEYWRDELRAGLGTVAGALLPLIPDLGAIVDPLAPIPPLAPREARQRLLLAVQRFVATLAIRGRGLVLVLDDLQWADASSLELLAAILQLEPIGSLLVIGTLREGEQSERVRGWLRRVASDVKLHEIALEPLAIEETQELLAEVLHRTPEETRRLAELVALKTASNPLQIRQFLIELRDRGMLRYTHGDGWHWDAFGLAELDVVDSVASYMVKRLGALPESARRVLGLASLIGDAFDVEYLFELSSVDRMELLQVLTELSEQGILAPCRQGFRFAHDRIREAARATLSPEETARLHRDAARTLFAQTPPDQLALRAAEIADHLNAAGDPVEDAERAHALDINLRAGLRALGDFAPSSAARYFERARSLAGTGIWDAQRELGFEIHLNLAESLLQTGDFAGCLELLDGIGRHDWDVVRAARLDAKRISVEVLRDGPDQLVGPTLAVLRRYGVRFPANPGGLRARAVVAWTDWRLRGALSKEGLVSRGYVPDELRRAQSILMLATGAILASEGRLYLFSCAARMRTFLKYGPPALEWAALALVGYAATRMDLERDFERSAEYAEVALAWCSSKPDSPARWLAEYVVEGFVRSTLHGHRRAAAALEGVTKKLLEVGNVEYLSYALLNRSLHLALGGGPLAEIEKQLASLPDAEGREVLPNRCLMRALRLLQSPVDEAQGREIAELDQAIHSRRWDRYGPSAVWVMVLAMLGRFEEVLAAYRRHTYVFQAFRVDLCFYTALAACALASSRGSRERRRLCRLARRHARDLETRARVNADVRHLVQVLRAELLALDGDFSRALDAYTEAAARAGSVGYVNHAALVLERKLQLLCALGRRVDADLVREECAALYEAWGARSKAQSVRSAPPWS